MDQVAEIISYPESWTRTTVNASVLGLFVHRGAAVPVLCLASLLGRQPSTVSTASCVLLVKVENDRFGFAVEAMRAIDPLACRDPEVAVDGAVAAARALEDAPLVTLGEDPKLLPELDLRALAAAVRREMSEPSSPDVLSSMVSDERETLLEDCV